MAKIEEHPDYFPKVKRSMFHKRKLDASQPDVIMGEGVEEHDQADIQPLADQPPVDQPPDTTLVACTVNIKPNKVMNRRRWKLYSQDQQRNLLTRLESSFRNKTPSVKLKILTFEVCPKLGQVHFHAMYECPRIFMSTIHNYWNEKVDGNDLNTKEPWRHIVLEEVYDQKGWIQYITKQSTR